MTDLEILKAAARISDSEYGVWAYDTWDELNRSHFDNKLTVGGIHWGLTPHGHALGFYSPSRNHITLHLSLVAPRGDAWGISRLLGEKFAADVLLHEMIHQFNYQIDECQNNLAGHNSGLWSNQINRIAPALGLKANAKPVMQKRVKEPGTKGNGKVTWFVEDGMMTRRELASWPHSARPDGYYEKAVQGLLASVTPS